MKGTKVDVIQYLISCYKAWIFFSSNTIWLTLPKYLSRSSTYLWMISSTASSLSPCSTAQQKYRLAYLQSHTTLRRVRREPLALSTFCTRFWDPSTLRRTTSLVSLWGWRRWARGTFSSWSARTARRTTSAGAACPAGWTGAWTESGKRCKRPSAWTPG